MNDTELPPTAKATEYRLTLLPEDHPDSHVFELKVSWRGRGKWAVMRHSLCLGTDGEWDYEPSPSNREDDWIDSHRFDLPTALRLADEALPSLRINGMTAADVLHAYES